MKKIIIICALLLVSMCCVFALQHAVYVNADTLSDITDLDSKNFDAEIGLEYNCFINDTWYIGAEGTAPVYVDINKNGDGFEGFSERYSYLGLIGASYKPGSVFHLDVEAGAGMYWSKVCAKEKIEAGFLLSNHIDLKVGVTFMETFDSFKTTCGVAVAAGYKF